MVAQGMQGDGYAVPTYRASSGAVWYHFLHGNVPGHQIDFIYRPEVPQGPLTQQHFSHLSRLMKYIEPRSRSTYAFAIGNLSRDDTQYEPGRGAVALIFGLRIHGAKDHAGRQDPPFCHSVVAVDRHFSPAVLFAAAKVFQSRLLPGQETQSSGAEWYHAYVRPGQDAAEQLPILQSYLSNFENLPAPAPSALGFQWSLNGAMPPSRVMIVHRDDEDFEVIAECAARIVGVLVESDIRWTAVSTGREADVHGGVSIRFVPEQEAGTQEAGVVVMRVEDVPEEPAEIAEQLFGAGELRSSQVPDLRMGWRQLYGNQPPAPDASHPVEGAPSSVGRVSSMRPPAFTEEVLVEVGDDGAEKARVSNGPASEPKARSESLQAPAESTLIKRDDKKASRSGRQFGVLIGIGVAVAIGGAIAAVVIGARESKGEVELGVVPTGESSAKGDALPEANALPAVSTTQRVTVSTAEPADMSSDPSATPAKDEKSGRSVGVVPLKQPVVGKKPSSVFVVP